MPAGDVYTELTSLSHSLSLWFDFRREVGMLFGGGGSSLWAFLPAGRVEMPPLLDLIDGAPSLLFH